MIPPAITALSSPVLAHVGHAGPENSLTQLLILAGVIAIVGSFMLRGQTARPWIPWSALGAGIALIAAAFLIPQGHSGLKCPPPRE